MLDGSVKMTNMHFVFLFRRLFALKTKIEKEYIKTEEEALLEVTGSKVCLNEADGRKEQKRLVYLSSPLRMEGDSLAAV